MSYPTEEQFITPKPSSMFSFTTTVAPTLPVSPPKEVSSSAGPKYHSPAREVLPLFFSHLERYQFAEASSVLSLASSGIDHVWALLPHLQLFTACESIYYSLIFLEAFSTNQYMETMYAEVRSAIEKVHEVWARKHGQVRSLVSARVVPPPDPMLATADAMSYYCQLLLDLVVYLGCRAKLVELRLTLHKKAIEAANATSLKQGLAVLTGISVHLPLLKHQLLVQLCRNMAIEVILYQKLLQTESAILNYQVNDAIFHFNALDLELQSCRSKFTFLKEKRETSAFLDTALFHWYDSYRDHLHEKMTLLFVEYRSQKVELQSNEPYAQEAGAELILHEKIVEFAAQTGCFNVSMILRPADGMGSGKSSWVPIYTFPQKEAPLSHWPSIISLYQDNMEELDSPIKTSSAPLPSPLGNESSVHTLHRHHSSPSAVVAIPASTPSGSIIAFKDPNSIPLFILHYYDTHVDITYYMATLQPKMLLVVIFKGERPQGDAEVDGFVKGLYAKLRHSQLLQKVLSRASGASSPASTSSPSSSSNNLPTNNNSTTEDATITLPDNSEATSTDGSRSSSSSS